MRSQQLDELVQRDLGRARPGDAGGQGAAVKAVTPRRLRERALRATLDSASCWATPRPPEESVMLEIRRRFKGEVVALSEYMDRDLVALWGYDKLD